MKNQISFSQAVNGYLMAAQARRLSQYTIYDYVNTFRKFQVFLDDDPPIQDIQSRQVEAFLATQEVSKKTLLNYHIGLSALWTWAVKEELVPAHILRKVERPSPEKRSIAPYSLGDVKAMLDVLKHSRPYTRPRKGESQHSLPNTERNRAIILMLLDTGARASELCGLRIHNVDMRNRRLTVFGKGSKERTLPFSSRTGQAIWRYLATRNNDSAGDYLFITIKGTPLTRDELRQSLVRIGQRAGVQDVNVHRFRHTFAINFLRNGGDAYALQMMLGHTTMEMVKTYLSLAQADLEKSHKIASPVDNWRL